MYESLISETIKKSVENKVADISKFKENSFDTNNDLLSASNKELSNYNKLIDSNDDAMIN